MNQGGTQTRSGIFNAYLIYTFICKLQRKVLRNQTYPHLFTTTLFAELKTRHVLLYCAVESQSEQLQKHIRNADHSNFHLFQVKENGDFKNTTEI